MLKLKLFLLSIIFLLTTSCKKDYQAVVSGNLYYDCSGTPLIGSGVEIYNYVRKNVKTASTLTDSNGYFYVELNGQGPIDLRFEFKGGTLFLNFQELLYYEKDTANIYIQSDKALIKDTLYIMILPLGYSEGPNKKSPVLKYTKDDFSTEDLLLVKYDRRLLQFYSTDSENDLYRLWVENLIEAKVVWGFGYEQFIESKGNYYNKKEGDNFRVKRIKLRGCDNSNTLILN